MANNALEENLFDVTVSQMYALEHNNHSEATSGNAPNKMETQALSPVLDPECGCEIKVVVGKGLGVFATRDLKRGTRIISEKPLIFAKAPENITWPKYTSESAEKQIADLSSNDKEVFMQLSCGAQSEETMTMSIFTTNAFSLGKHGTGIFPLSSRLNHSCVPNAWWYFNDNIGHLVVQTIMDIACGDELTILYIDVEKIAERRKEELLERYGFLCDCYACDGANNVDSDRRREEIVQIERIVYYYNQVYDMAVDVFGAKDPLPQIKRKIELLKLENLVGVGLGRAYHDAAFWSFKIGDIEETKKWKILEYETDLYCLGDDCEETMTTKKTLEGL